MTYKLAKRILDKVREGVQYPLQIINRALEVTGDLEQDQE
jgi:hypothetical protein